MALITFKPHYKNKRAMTVPHDKAKVIYANWKNPPGDLSEEQYDMLKCIEKIYFNTGKQASQSITRDPQTDMLHEGRLQGKSEMLPTGDR